jgi:hypothetical protein
MAAQHYWVGIAMSCLFLDISFAAAKPIPKQDRSWKPYRNAQAGYCLSYPGRWRRGEAFDGAGFYVATGVSRYSRPVGEIDVAVFANPGEVHSADTSLSDDAQQHLQGLVTFERAEKMQVVERRSLQFLGSPAFLTKDSYYDPQGKEVWSDEVIFVEYEGRVFRLELECRKDQLDRFQQDFDRLLSSFRFSCSAER